MIQALYRSGCDGTFEPAAFIGPVVKGVFLREMRLFSIYRVDPTRFASGDFPAGEYGIVFVGVFPGRPPAGPGVVNVTIDAEGRILSWHSFCGVVDPYTYPAEVPFPIAEYILPPLG